MLSHTHTHTLAMPPKGKAPRKAANGYRLPDPLPQGEIIESVHTKKKWRLGKSIGKRKYIASLAY